MANPYKEEDTANMERYMCKHIGCGKSFQRKEHLSRHTSSHSGPRHACTVCQKEFTRSDTLQRHLQLHSDVIKRTPYRRNKRACTTCHSSKIKCDGDGDQPCTACVKRDLKCLYQHVENSSDVVEIEKADNIQTPLSQPSLLLPHKQSASTMSPTSKSQGLPQTQRPLTGNIPNRVATGMNENTPLLELFSSYLKNRSKGPVDWSQLRIEKDLPEPTKTHSPGTSNEESFYPLPFQDAERYHETYFKYFHHRWLVVHRPTYMNSARFIEDGACPVVNSSVNMIGAWLDGNSELAILIHDKLVGHLLPFLYQISSTDHYHKQNPLGLFNATLLNIIFGLYYGTERLVSRAVGLRNALVGALREIKFFDRETFLRYDNSNTFFPNLFTRQQKRSRFAAILFRIDSYLSLLRGTPALLQSSDLHFTLPCTLPVYNTNTLHTWEIRYSAEPEWRRQLSINGVIQSPMNSEAFPLLAEDIQLGISALQSKVCHVWQQFEINKTERVELKNMLQKWKILLFRVSIQPSHQPDYSLEQDRAISAYHSYEESPAPGWQEDVIILPKTIFIDTLFSYYITGIHLSAPVQIFSRVAEDMVSPENTKGWGEELRLCVETRAGWIRAWTKSPDARRALCFAADILSAYNKVSEAEKQGIDPIAYAALSTGALVLWAYCEFGLHNCEECALVAFVSTGSFEFEGLKKVELTMWSDTTQHETLELLKQSWIEQGGGRVTLEGSDLCRCFVTLLLGKYKACIPSSWEYKEVIAPGLWNGIDEAVL